MRAYSSPPLAKVSWVQFLPRGVEVTQALRGRSRSRPIITGQTSGCIRQASSGQNQPRFGPRSFSGSFAVRKNTVRRPFRRTVFSPLR